MSKAWTRGHHSGVLPPNSGRYSQRAPAGAASVESLLPPPAVEPPVPEETHVGVRAPQSSGVKTVIASRYAVLEQLDEGGMGHVYLAWDQQEQERVAVKVLDAKYAKDRNAQSRLYREAEIIGELDHPHIVQVKDSGLTRAGLPYVVLELLEGESLERRLERGRLSLKKTLDVAMQIADALLAVHVRDIVHRDLKPGNVFLQDRATLPLGQSVHIKLLDFGIGRQATQSSSITGEHDIMGTVEYMTPEQASGRTAQVDHRGDQFSLAVIVYEMLTGTVPFPGETVGEILDSIQQKTPTPPSAFGVPAAFDGVLARALAKVPGHRYASVQEFAVALAEAAEGPGASLSSAPPAPCMTVPPQDPRLPFATTEPLMPLTRPTPTGVRRQRPPLPEGQAKAAQKSAKSGRWDAPSSDRSPPSGRYSMPPGRGQIESIRPTSAGAKRGR